MIYTILVVTRGERVGHIYNIFDDKAFFCCCLWKPHKKKPYAVAFYVGLYLDIYAVLSTSCILNATTHKVNATETSPQI